VTGQVARADVCALWKPYVYGGRIDFDTFIAPGAWRGTVWPCTGATDLRAGGTPTQPTLPFGVLECTCSCHAGGEQHELPGRANRTGVHPTDVLSDARRR
jgi:hypothetical protein